MFQQDAAQWHSPEANFPYNKITRTRIYKFLVDGGFEVCPLTLQGQTIICLI
jgi:hypothetical protein